MNLMPMHTYGPSDRPWVIRWLRFLGYVVLIPCAVLGAILLAPVLTGALASLLGLDYNGAAFFGCIIGGVVGILGGLIVMAPYWGLAMLLDDIHAIRAQTSGYVEINEKPGAL